MSDQLGLLWDTILSSVLKNWYQRMLPFWPWHITALIGATGAGLISLTGAASLQRFIRDYLQRIKAAKLSQRLNYKEAWQRMRGVAAERNFWQRALDDTAKAWQDAGVAVDPRWVWAGQTVLASLGGVFGVIALRNIPVGVLLLAVGWLLPLQIIRAGTERTRRAVQRDLIQAFHFFSVEFHESHHVARALERAADRLRPGVVRDTFERTARRLLVGEHYQTTVATMAADFSGHPYGVLFAQMCGLAVEDASFAPMFSTLVVRMNERILLERRSRSAMVGVRTLALMLNTMVLPAALAAVWIVPDGYVIYTETAQGRVALLVVVVLMLVGFAVNRNAGKVPDL